MNWFWMNIPAALVFLGLWSGIPLWLVLKRPDRGPESLAVQAPARTRPVAPAEPQITLVPEASKHPVGV
jgi:hypothetical protein